MISIITLIHTYYVSFFNTQFFNLTTLSILASLQIASLLKNNNIYKLMILIQSKPTHNIYFECLFLTFYRHILTHSLLSAE